MPSDPHASGCLLGSLLLHFRSLQKCRPPTFPDHLDPNLQSLRSPALPLPVPPLVWLPFIHLYVLSSDCSSSRGQAASLPSARCLRQNLTWSSCKAPPSQPPSDPTPTPPAPGACSRAPPSAGARHGARSTKSAGTARPSKEQAFLGAPLPPPLPRASGAHEARVQTGRHEWIPGAKGAACWAQRLPTVV